MSDAESPHETLGALARRFGVAQQMLEADAGARNSRIEKTVVTLGGRVIALPEASQVALSDIRSTVARCYRFVTPK